MAHKYSAKTIDTWVEMYNSGMSTPQIAEVVGVRMSSVWSAILTRGVPMRFSKRGDKSNFYRGGSFKSDKVRCQVNAAIRRGDVTVSNTCSECGATKACRNGQRGVVAHHDNYNKPLDIRWLCVKCHTEWHKYNKAIPVFKVRDVKFSKPISAPAT